MKKRLLVSTMIFALGALLSTSIGLAAPKRVVTMWSYADNNITEWRARQADIEKKFNIVLKIEQVPQNAFVQRLQATMMDGRNCPDIIEWMIENNRILNAKPAKSFVAPLNKYVSKSAAFKKVVPGRVGWVKYGNNIYGLPHDVHPVVLLYNDTLWKSVGVDMEKINTWDEFFVAAQKLIVEKKNGKPVHYALPETGGMNGTMFMIWQQTGSQMLDKKGNPTLQSVAFKSYVNQWLKWYSTGTMCAWDWGNFAALLNNGTLASYCTPDWWISQVDTAARTGKYKFKVRALPYYKKGGSRTASWGGTFLAITRLAKDQDQLYKIMEYMQYDESSIKTRYKTTGMLPPFASVWSDEVFKEADPRFGGQKLGQLQVQMAKEMPSVNNGDIFWDAINDFNGQYTEMQAGKITVDAGLKKAQADAKKRVVK